MPLSVVQEIETQLKALISSESGVPVASVTKKITEALNSVTSPITTFVDNTLNGLKDTLYGQQITNKDGTIDYSKLYIWRIVFISTVTVASVLIMAGFLYAICLGIDKAIKRKDVKKAKEAIKNI